MTLRDLWLSLSVVPRAWWRRPRRVAAWIVTSTTLIRALRRARSADGRR